jgi:hypothetical protein
VGCLTTTKGSLCLSLFAQQADTLTLDDAAHVATTGYTVGQIEAARERLAEIRALDEMERRAGTQ